MTAQLPPLADIFDQIKIWAPIIFFVLYGIAQVVGSVQQEKRKAARKRPPPAPDLPKNPAAPQAGGKPPTLEDTLRREVDEFLRRAQGQAPPAQKTPPARKAPPKQAEPTRPRRLEPRPQPAAAPPAPATPPPARSAPAARRSISQRVEQDLRGAASVAQHAGALGAEVAQHAVTLGADVAQADERMEQHLREKFSHQLGTFVHAEHGDAKPAAHTKIALDIRKMLASPEGAKQLIVASEILQRPTHRW
jgi:hypothetical protein